MIDQLLSVVLDPLRLLDILIDGVSSGAQFWVQLKSVVITVAWTAVASFIILKIAGALVGLRVDAQTETEGLDLAEHGERGYHNG